MNYNKENKIVIIIIVTVLLALSAILLMTGINDIVVKDEIAANVELSKLYIELGYSSTNEWLDDYMLNAYFVLIGGLFLAVLAIWIFVKKKE